MKRILLLDWVVLLFDGARCSFGSRTQQCFSLAWDLRRGEDLEPAEKKHPSKVGPYFFPPTPPRLVRLSN